MNLREKYFVGKEAVKNALWKIGFIPEATESRAFVMAATLLVLAVSGKIWTDLEPILFFNENSATLIFVIAYICVGAFLSIYHAFTYRKKKNWEIKALQGFTIATLALLAFMTAVYSYQEKQTFFLIFTIWNALQCFTLLFLSEGYVRLGSKQITYKEVLLALFVVGFITSVTNSFNTNWTVSFSLVLMVWSLIEKFSKPQIKY